MIRPATVLTVLLTGALILLFLASLSAPVIKLIPLGQTDDVRFGVWGSCAFGATSSCTPITVGYDVDRNGIATHYSLPPAIRSKLTYVLIVHPIAAAFVLACLLIALLAHRHGPSRSPRYLLGLFLAISATLVLTALAIIVDVLLFVPHLAWGSYLVIAAGILLALATVFSWFTRRAVKVRIANQRRVDANPEMNGLNYHLNRPKASLDEDTPATGTVWDFGAKSANKPAGNPDVLPSFTPLPPLPASHTGSQPSEGKTMSADSTSSASNSLPVYPPSGTSTAASDGGYPASRFGPGAPPAGHLRQYPHPVAKKPSPARHHGSGPGQMPSRPSDGRPYPPPSNQYPQAQQMRPQQRAPHPPSQAGSSTVASFGTGHGDQGPFPPHSQQRAPIQPTAPHSQGPVPQDQRFPPRSSQPQYAAYNPNSSASSGATQPEAHTPPGYEHSNYSGATNPRESYYPSYSDSRQPGRLLSPIAASPPSVPINSTNQAEPAELASPTEPTHSSSGDNSAPSTAAPPPNTAPGPEQTPGPTQAPLTSNWGPPPPPPSSGYTGFVPPSQGRGGGPSGYRGPYRSMNRSNTGMDGPGSGGRGIQPSLSSSSLASGGRLARSPTASESSYLTSVSQRGVNPNWRSPNSGGGGPSGRYNSRVNEDVILSNNPEFSLPGSRVNRARGGPAGGSGHGHIRGAGRSSMGSKGSIRSNPMGSMQPSPYPPMMPVPPNRDHMPRPFEAQDNGRYPAPGSIQ